MSKDPAFIDWTEHYANALDLIEEARDFDWTEKTGRKEAKNFLLQAQVEATLAAVQVLRRLDR